MNQDYCKNCGKNRPLINGLCKWCRGWETRRKEEEDDWRHNAMLAYFSGGIKSR